MTNTQSNQLTKYPSASVGELLHISLPMMLTALSGTLMIFADRLILAQYSVNAMNAAVSAGIIVGVLQYGGIHFTSIAQVFAGENYGAKRFAKVAEPVWQMIWFSMATFIIFLPLAFYGAELLLPNRFEEFSLPYFRWLMAFGPTLPLIAALTAFYVCQGKTTLVMVSALISNVLNVILDIILVFGIAGWIPEMGTAGAAIATVISQLLQILLLFRVFITPRNQAKFKTWNCHLNFKVIWQCFNVGYPNALGHMIEISAIAVIVYLMTIVSATHATVLSVALSTFILFTFFHGGLQRGIITVAANLMGAKNTQLIPKLVRSSLVIYLGFAVLLIIPLIVYPFPLIDAFLTEDVFPAASLGQVKSITRIALIWLWFAIIFDSMKWGFMGILTVGKDTKFIMLVNASSVWIFAVLPIYFFVLVWGASAHYAMLMIALNLLVNFGIFLARYLSGKWLQEEDKRVRTKKAPDAPGAFCL